MWQVRLRTAISVYFTLLLRESESICRYSMVAAHTGGSTEHHSGCSTQLYTRRRFSSEDPHAAVRRAVTIPLRPERTDKAYILLTKGFIQADVARQAFN